MVNLLNGVCSEKEVKDYNAKWKNNNKQNLLLIRSVIALSIEDIQKAMKGRDSTAREAIIYLAMRVDQNFSKEMLKSDFKAKYNPEKKDVRINNYLGENSDELYFSQISIILPDSLPICITFKKLFNLDTASLKLEQGSFLVSETRFNSRLEY